METVESEDLQLSFPIDQITLETSRELNLLRQYFTHDINFIRNLEGISCQLIYIMIIKNAFKSNEHYCVPSSQLSFESMM